MAGSGRFADGFALGDWQTNCFVVGDRELGSAVVIDPGQYGAAPVQERLADRQVRCEAILLTHGHIDHLWAAPELARALDAPVLLHAEDAYLWRNPAAGWDDRLSDADGRALLRIQFGLEWTPDTTAIDAIADGQRLDFAGLTFEVAHTPGHTPGSCVFLARDGLAEDPVLFSGDLLFAGSVGRTDFPRGSWQDLLASIERAVWPLPDATVVRPGHGPGTTVGRERATNPFLRDLA